MLNIFFKQDSVITGSLSSGLSRTIILFLLVEALHDVHALVLQHNLCIGANPLCHPFSRFPPCAPRISFRKHGLRVPSFPHTFLWIPAHPNAWLFEHATETHGLRFGLVNIDEMMRSLRLFPWRRLLRALRPQ